MSPFARARTSAGSDLATDLRATIAKVDELIRIEQTHNNALRELITGLVTRLQSDLSAVRRTATALEGRMTAVEELVTTIEGQNRTILQAITDLRADLASFRSEYGGHHH